MKAAARHAHSRHSAPAKAVLRDGAARQALVQRALQLQQQGAETQAAALFRQVLAQNPNDAVAIYSLTDLLLRGGATGEALALAQRGVALVPGFAPMWFAQGMALRAAGRKQDALGSFDRAIAVNPQFIEALLNSGALLRELYRHKAALERFTQVLAIDPRQPLALANCGILWTEFKKSDLAIAMFARLLEIQPDAPFIAGLLCYERLHAGDWTDFDRLSRQIVDGLRAGKPTCKSFALMAISDSPQDQLISARIFAAASLAKPQPPLWNGERYGHARLRIAYVSPDLREHPVAHLTAGLFEHHDRTRFETFAFSYGVDDGGQLRQRFQQRCFEHFIDVQALGPRQIAELMRAHEIDIAIDLAGWTSDARIDIFANRPAPLQVGFLGYPGTLGTDFMDRIIADRHVIPPEHQRCYSEQVAYLPDTYLPTDASLQIAERTPTRAECGLPEQGAVLCAFSHNYKMHPQIFAVWMRLLQRLPGSVLWLASRNEASHANLRAAAVAQGVDPARLVFALRVPRIEDHLARYRQADLFLDTWPFNAHTTAADALMAGLPVVTFMGESFPARVAGSLLHAIGLPELITHSLADYEALVLELMADPARLAGLRQRLLANRSTHALFDTARFCRNLEAAFLDMHQQVFPAAAALPAPAAAAA